METLFFWIAWGIISVWALRTFYFSFSKEKLERLRKTSVGLTASVLVLTLTLAAAIPGRGKRRFSGAWR